MRKIFNLAFIFLSLFLVSCQDFYNKEEKTYTITLANKEIKTRAFGFAKLYSESETEYQWGGQSPLRAIKIDCSGLVVMCYKYALVDTSSTRNYRLA